jgi:phosphate transport system substrate-binding protein
MESRTGAVAIEIQGGGSSTGIQAARSGAAGIGMSSRLLKKEEAAELTPRVVALDAIVVVVHPSSDLADLSTERVRDLFSGAAADWRDVGRVRPGRITAVTREEGSGTRAAFEELSRQPIPTASCRTRRGAVRVIVAADPPRWAISPWPRRHA